VILSGAIPLSERVIELGGERQFTNEVAQRSFIKHDF
jgi:hypothetical protein